MKLYGIPNCNTVKKARDWLANNGIDYEFHDFKKQGVTPTQLDSWLKQIPDSKLINRAGMTWRKLDEATKNNITNKDAAIQLMCDKTSVIKRPILEKEGQIIALGFSESEYQSIFK